MKINIILLFFVFFCSVISSAVVPYKCNYALSDLRDAKRYQCNFWNTTRYVYYHPSVVCFDDMPILGRVLIAYLSNDGTSVILDPEGLRIVTTKNAFGKLAAVEGRDYRNTRFYYNECRIK